MWDPTLAATTSKGHLVDDDTDVDDKFNDDSF